MESAYKNNNDTLMTWDIFQHQEQILRQPGSRNQPDIAGHNPQSVPAQTERQPD